MNRDPIFIRVDANPQVGYERLARCLIYAAALQRRRRPTYFLADLEPRTLAFAIKRGGNEWLPMDHRAGSMDDMGQVLQEVRRLQPAALLVDAETNQDYLRELAESGPLLASMDHHADLKFPAHLVINPLLGPSKETYEFDTGAQLLLGRRFALVRPEIRRHRPTRSQEPAPLAPPPGKAASGKFRALVALGEDDPHRRTLELARMLLNSPGVGKVDIIVRREHPDLEVIQDAVAQNEDKLELALEPAEIAARLVRCHFAVTSGSGWSLELACMGVPQLLIVQNEGHWPNAQRLEEEGCAACLGWHESVSHHTVRTAVQNLLNDPLERQAMARCGRKLIDGRGPDRLVNALELMLHHPSRLSRVGEAA